MYKLHNKNLLVDQMLARVQLTKGKLVVVFIVEHIHQVSKEGVDFLNKLVEN